MGRIEVTERRGRRRKQLLDDLKEWIHRTEQDDAIVSLYAYIWGQISSNLDRITGHPELNVRGFLLFLQANVGVVLSNRLWPTPSKPIHNRQS